MATLPPMIEQPQFKMPFGLLVGIGAFVVALMLWGVWMTKNVRDLREEKTPFVSVALQPLVSEFIQTQARAGGSEEQAAVAVQRFMGALETELQQRGKNGQTIIVSEAVVSKNIPDITADVRKSVYSKVGASSPSLPSPGVGAPAMPQAAPAAPAMPGFGQ